MIYIAHKNADADNNIDRIDNALLDRELFVFYLLSDVQYGAN